MQSAERLGPVAGPKQVRGADHEGGDREEPLDGFIHGRHPSCPSGRPGSNEVVSGCLLSTLFAFFGDFIHTGGPSPRYAEPRTRVKYADSGCSIEYNRSPERG